MLNTKEQSCPLCGVAAVFYYVDHGDKKYFKCTSCRKYMISIDAEIFISESTQEVRNKIAEQAKGSAEDEAAVILLRMADSNKVVSVKYSKKAELNV